MTSYRLMLARLLLLTALCSHVLLQCVAAETSQSGSAFPNLQRDLTSTNWAVRCRLAETLAHYHGDGFGSPPSGGPRGAREAPEKQKAPAQSCD